MPIPESQLEVWSHQGAVTTARQTHESIRTALSRYQFSQGVSYEVYLQGSYKNTTNIRSDSDVDVVVELDSTFYHNLTEDQLRLLGFSDARYGWADFKNEVLTAVQRYYGANRVRPGSKAIKVDTPYLPADVVVCAQHRNYLSLTADDFVQAITMYSSEDSCWIVNYPRIHYDNGVTKQQQTQGWFKPTIRLFKNIRNALIDRRRLSDPDAPSYFVECFLYNAPSRNFGLSYQDTVISVFNYLNSADLGQFASQNEQLALFGEANEQWSQQAARLFLAAIREMWDNWR
jgi:hypothetical protein